MTTDESRVLDISTGWAAIKEAGAQRPEWLATWHATVLLETY